MKVGDIVRVINPNSIRFNTVGVIEGRGFGLSFVIRAQNGVNNDEWLISRGALEKGRDAVKQPESGLFRVVQCRRIWESGEALPDIGDYLRYVGAAPEPISELICCGSCSRTYERMTCTQGQ